MAKTISVRCGCRRERRKQCQICKGTGRRIIQRNAANHDIASFLILFNTLIFHSMKLKTEMRAAMNQKFKKFFDEGTKIMTMFESHLRDSDGSMNHSDENAEYVLEAMEVVMNVKDRKNLLKIMVDYQEGEKKAFQS